VAFLLSVAGCHFLDKAQQDAGVVADAVMPAISFSAMAVNGHVYYSASVDATSISFQNLLRRLGLPVTVSQDANGVRIASATPDGMHFTLVIQSETSPGGTAKQTKVYVEWENPSDGGNGFKVLAELETQSVKQAAGTTTK
jgi:hypothetical protein